MTPLSDQEASGLNILDTIYFNYFFPKSCHVQMMSMNYYFRVGAIMAPYIKNLGAGTSQSWIPLAIFGVSGIIR